MHGIIHSELKDYIERRYGNDIWKAILKEVGLGNKIYIHIGIYPDEEAIKIVTAASHVTGTPGEKLLEDFGEFIAPKLLDMHKSLIKPEWKTLDLLLNTEETIHRVVRLKNPDADPPKLQFEWIGSKRLKFYYNSPRRMSAVAKGIIKGVARHYQETVTIQEQKKNDIGCEMTIEIR